MSEHARGDRATIVPIAVLGVIAVAAIIVPIIAPEHAVADVVASRFIAPLTRGPTGELHLIGTDRLGRDLWTRLWLGARVSLIVGVLTVLVSLAIGAVVGAAAARGSAPTRAAALGATDFALGIPRVVLLLLLATLWQPGTVQVVVVLGLTGWMPIARLVNTALRAQAAEPYVGGAIALGVTRNRLLWHHMLPNITAPVMAAVTLGIGNAITLEAGLSFLGLGVQPPATSWGTLIASGRDTVVNAPWVGLAPGIALVVVVIACTLLSDVLQEGTTSAG